MKHDEVYSSWVQARKQIPIDPAFADRTMERVARRETPREMRATEWPRLIEQIAISPWAKAAAIGIASLLGLGRLLLIVHLLLFA
jgi:hypothetical protein